MASWTFPSDAQGWSLAGGMAWKVAEGNPPGCLGGGDASITVSIPTLEGDPMSMWYRAKSNTDTSIDIGTILITLLANNQPMLQAVLEIEPEMAGLPYDTGWIKLSDTNNLLNETITALSIETTNGTSNGYIVFIDTVFVTEIEPETFDSASLYYGTNNINNSVPIVVT